MAPGTGQKMLGVVHMLPVVKENVDHSLGCPQSVSYPAAYQEA